MAGVSVVRPSLAVSGVINLAGGRDPVGGVGTRGGGGCRVVDMAAGRSGGAGRCLGAPLSLVRVLVVVGDALIRA